ncbi:hypothetical protein [Crocosphaera sp.]|uniref:hypothetical protein n=1 Tax=Crocosphaera sp. TaxID=2729996 RepID=UPI002635EAF8|nr:hypothetical protein [Crocosphaera sp.]MDJ0578412.1 hypothetical protein [Crocosphaera sp.]
MLVLKSGLSKEELCEIFDPKFPFILIESFEPKGLSKWWQTDLKFLGTKFKNLSIRHMIFDIQTDLEGFKKIFQLNTPHYLSIYQFDKPIPDTLVPRFLPDNNKERILKQNGLKHHYLFNFEFLTITSFEEEFLTEIKMNEEKFGVIG